MSDLIADIRSKNAGPFWVTIDIFCTDDAAFKTVQARLRNEDVAQVLGADLGTLKRFDIEDLAVIKFSIPRPNIQGARLDRDMHGASFSVLIKELLGA